MFNVMAALAEVERVMAGACVLFEVLAHVTQRAEGIAVAMWLATWCASHVLRVAQRAMRR